jgi:acetyl esterase/lipase
MGACVVVVNYALCPGTPKQPVTIPDIALQMTHALAWVWRNIAQYGGNPKDVVVAGHSAGGHLAAMVGLTGDNKTLDPVGPHSGVSTRVQAVVDMYGPMADDSKRL